MTANHRLPLLAFLTLSALCLLLAALGLVGPGALPRAPQGSLLAGGMPEHLRGETLQGRTSVLIPALEPDPIVPPIAQGRPEQDSTGGNSTAPAAVVSAPISAPTSAPGTARTPAQHRRHRRASHPATAHHSGHSTRAPSGHRARGAGSPPSRSPRHGHARHHVAPGPPQHAVHHAVHRAAQRAVHHPGHHATQRRLRHWMVARVRHRGHAHAPHAHGHGHAHRHRHRGRH